MFIPFDYLSIPIQNRLIISIPSNINKSVYNYAALSHVILLIRLYYYLFFQLLGV